MARTMQHYVDNFESVPVLVFACYVRYRRHTAATDGASVFPACQNLLLAARSLGYGGVLTGLHHFAETRTAGSPACARGSRVHGDHHTGTPAGPPRPGAPPPHVRSWSSASAGVRPRPGPWTREGTRFTAAGPPRRQLIQSGCCATPRQPGKADHAHPRLSRLRRRQPLLRGARRLHPPSRSGAGAPGDRVGRGQRPALPLRGRPHQPCRDQPHLQPDFAGGRSVRLFPGQSERRAHARADGKARTHPSRVPRPRTPGWP